MPHNCAVSTFVPFHALRALGILWAWVFTNIWYKIVSSGRRGLGRVPCFTDTDDTHNNYHKNISGRNQHFRPDLAIVTTWLLITMHVKYSFSVLMRREIWIQFWYCVTLFKLEKSHSCHVIIFYLMANNHNDPRTGTSHPIVAHVKPQFISESKEFRIYRGLSSILLWLSGNTVLSIVIKVVINVLPMQAMKLYEWVEVDLRSF